MIVLFINNLIKIQKKIEEENYKVLQHNEEKLKR